MGEGDQLLIEVPFLWDKSYKKINIDHEIYVRNPTRTVCTKIQVALEERNPHPVPLARTNRVTKKLTMTDLVRTFDALRPFGVHIAFSDIFHHLHEARLIPRSIGGVWFQNNLERILFFSFRSSLNSWILKRWSGRPCCSVTKTALTYTRGRLYRFFLVVCPLMANQDFFPSLVFIQ